MRLASQTRATEMGLVTALKSAPQKVFKVIKCHLGNLSYVQYTRLQTLIGMSLTSARFLTNYHMFYRVFLVFYVTIIEMKL